MEATELESGSYPGTYKLVGGRLSLDFVNTVSWPGTPREHDWLDRTRNLTGWAAAAELIDGATRRTLDRRHDSIQDSELVEAHRIRSDLALVLRALTHKETPSPGSIAALNARLHTVAADRSIDSRTQRWAWIRPTTLLELVAPVVWDAAEVLTSLDHRRLGHCASCDWLFYDTTRNHSRRWCDMQDCGSRDKALRYYHRTKTVT